MTHQGIVAMVTIECGGSFVPLGSGGNERGRIGASGANCRVGERADMPIVIPQVDGEATELSGGNKLIGAGRLGMCDGSSRLETPDVAKACHVAGRTFDSDKAVGYPSAMSCIAC